MKQMKFIAAALAAVVFQTGNCMESWYGNALSHAFGGNAVQSVQIVYDNDPKLIKVINPELVPEEIKNIINGKPYFILIDKSGINEAAYSIDGINWKKTVLPYEDWESVCYGNNKFVAVGYTGTGDYLAHVVYSTNGKTWTESNLSDTEIPWNSICYGNNKFVAVSYDGKATSSADGINWNQEAVPINEFIGAVSVCYGNNTFVTFGSKSVETGTENKMELAAAHSNDGVTWSLANNFPTSGISSICYGKNTFVAVGPEKAAYSTNKGETWTEITEEKFPSEWQWRSVCYGNGKFVAVANDSKAACSTDGIHWNITNISETGWMSVCYGNGKFVAANPSEEELIYSKDGIHWSTPYTPSVIEEIIFPYVFSRSK